MEIEGGVGVQENDQLKIIHPSAASQDIAICYETAPIYTVGSVDGNPEFSAAVTAAASSSLQQREGGADGAPPTLSSTSTTITTTDQIQTMFSDNQEKFENDIAKWEEYYDQIHRHLSSKSGTPKERQFPKSASNFSLGQDGDLFYSKMTKDGTVLYLKVIRDYADRVRICREIHLDTDDVTLHHRRDRMLELLGQMYFWKGQRRDVCQCIASCVVCSAGLGAKRRAKPPGQKRDIPRQGGPPDPPKKRSKAGRPKKSMDPNEKTSIPLEVNSEALLVGNELSVASAILPAAHIAEVMNEPRHHHHHQHQQQTGSGDKNLTDSYVSTASERDSMHTPEVSFHQIFTTIDEDQTSPIVQSSISRVVTLDTQPPPPPPPPQSEEASIYELLFKIPSIPSSTSPSVVEAVHMAMKQTPDELHLFEAAESIMRQILSLGQGYNIIVTPTAAAAYVTAVFASMLRMDPLSVSSQISSNISCPMAVLHDSCCAQMANPCDLGPLKTCTALTGSYNWNLGDVTYPMDKDMVRMAVQSNRVAAVFYQPYAYIEKSQHISLESISAICHSRGSDVAVIVDATAIPTAHLNLRKLTTELKLFFEQGADLVLLPSVDKLRGQAHSSVLVGVSGLLSKVWRSIALLQKQVSLPLLCLPHDLVGTVVAYKALQDL